MLFRREKYPFSEVLEKSVEACAKLGKIVDATNNCCKTKLRRVLTAGKDDSMKSVDDSALVLALRHPFSCCESSSGPDDEWM